MLQRYNPRGILPYARAFQAGRAAARMYKKFGGKRRSASQPVRARKRVRSGTYDARSGQVAVPIKKSYRKKKTLPLKRRISRIENKIADKYNTVLFLQDDQNQIVCPPSQAVYTTYTLLASTELNSVLQKIRVLQSDATIQSEVDLDNTAVNPTLGIKGAKTFTFRNNFLSPVKMDIVEFECVDGTNSTPLTYQSNTYTEYGLTSFLTDPKTTMNCPFDSVLKTFWRKKGTKSYRLNAGDEVIYHLSTRQVDKTQQFWEQIDGNTYMKNVTKAIVVRVQGTVSHQDDAVTSVGWGEGTVDVIGQIRFYGRMPGQGIKRIYENGDATLLTNPDVAGPNVVHINEAG